MLGIIKKHNIIPNNLLVRFVVGLNLKITRIVIIGASIFYA